jgi:hypothetical protein
MSTGVNYSKSVPGGVSRHHHVLVDILGYNSPHFMKGHLSPCIKVIRRVRLCDAVTGVRCNVGVSLILHFI